MTPERRKYVQVEVDVSETVLTDIYPEDYPELIEWADHRHLNGPPGLAVDTLQYAAERLRFLCQFQVSDGLDRLELDGLATELADVVQRIQRDPANQKS